MVQKFWKDKNLRYIGEKDYVDENENEDVDGGGSDAVVLTFDHLQGAFIPLLLRLACGLIVFLIDLFCFSFRKLTNNLLLTL